MASCRLPAWTQTQLSKQKKFPAKMKLQIIHDLEIKKLKFGTLKMNEDHFAWHVFWHHISSKWSWFQASNWPINLQKIEMKFLQLWHHQGCVINVYLKGETSWALSQRNEPIRLLDIFIGLDFKEQFSLSSLSPQILHNVKFVLS